MARVFITGSSDGLGKMVAQLLAEQSHQVVPHALNEARGKDAMAAIPEAESVVIGDLSSIRQTRDVAEQVNALGAFDAVIHNAGVGYREPRRGPRKTDCPMSLPITRSRPTFSLR